MIEFFKNFKFESDDSSQKIENDKIHIGAFDIEVSYNLPFGRLRLVVDRKMNYPVLHAFRGCTKTQLEEFAKKHYVWITRAVERTKKESFNIENDILPGTKRYVWGKPYTVVINDNCIRNYVELIEDKLVLNFKFNSTLATRNKLLELFYKAETERVALELLPSYIEHVNSKCSALSVKKVKSYFGIYYSKDNRIILNSVLARYPVECLKCTLIHELIHYHEHNHGKRFYALLSEYYPEWKKAYKTMGKNK